MNSTNTGKVFSSFFWSFLERIGSQILQVLVTIILARLLEPKVFGTVALITVFTTILQVFVDSGMGNALIQKKDADDLDFSSVFYFNVATCIVLYICVFISAPLIANFYKMPNIVAVIRALSLTVLISGIRNIQQAYVSRYLLFKKFFYATLGGTIGGAAIGIWMAFTGYGVWALVVQNLVNLTLGTLILWCLVDWRPKLIFSLQRLRSLFNYGWKLLVSALLDIGSSNIIYFVIGKLYTTSDLAFYDRGRQFPNLIVNNVNTAIDNVLLPTMSAEQDNSERVRSLTRRAIQVSTYVMMPIMMLLALCAEPIVRLVFTEKWLPCVFFLRVFCFTFAFWPIHTANLNAIKAMGRSDIFLKLEISKKIIGIIALLATMYISVQAMALSLLVTSITSQIINAWPNKNLLNYCYTDQVKDMLPQIGLSCFMAGVVYNLQFLTCSDWLTLLMQFFLGVSLYLGVSKLLRFESFEYIVRIVKNI